MKRIFLYVGLLVTLLVGGFLAYSFWNSAPRRSQRYLESGKKYFQEKKYAEATIEFLNVLQTVPHDRDARFLLALTYMSQGNLLGAVNELKKILEYYPDDIPANLQLGEIYLAVGRADSKVFSLAQEIAEKVLAKEPGNLSALILSGNALIGLQDFLGAVERYERAVTVDDKNVAALIGLGAAHGLRKNYTEAERAFLKASQVAPKDKRALSSLANYYRATGNVEKATTAFEAALSAYPSDRDIYLPVAAFYDRIGRFERSEHVLREAAEKSANDPEPSLILADFYVSKKRPEDARRTLVELKKEFPASIDVAAKLAINLLRDQPERARAEIDQILKTDPENVAGQLLLGESQFFSGQYAAAEATLSKDAVLKSAYPEPHFFLGRIAGGKGNTDDALKHYEKALALRGTYLPARVALAEVLLTKGMIGESRLETRKALDLQSNFVPARLVKASLDTIEKKYLDAEKELTALLKDDPGNAIVHERMGFYYQLRGRQADAEKSYSRAVELQPNSPDIFQSLIRFYLATKQTARAIQRLDAVPDSQKQAVHHELIGLAHLQAGRSGDSEKAYKKALEKEPGRVAAGFFLASQSLQRGLIDEAFSYLNVLAKGDDANANVSASAHGMMGHIYETENKIAEAKKSYSEALKIDPNLGPVANNLAYILAEEGKDLAIALGLAQTARKQDPQNPSYADTLGWVQYRQGSYVQARAQFRFAVEKQPENPVFLYHLAMAYKETSQPDEASAALRKALSASKNLKEVFKERTLAEAALKELSLRKGS